MKTRRHCEEPEFHPRHPHEGRPAPARPAVRASHHRPLRHAQSPAICVSQPEDRSHRSTKRWPSKKRPNGDPALGTVRAGDRQTGQDARCGKPGPTHDPHAKELVRCVEYLDKLGKEMDAATREAVERTQRAGKGHASADGCLIEVALGTPDEFLNTKPCRI